MGRLKIYFNIINPYVRANDFLNDILCDFAYSFFQMLLWYVLVQTLYFTILIQKKMISMEIIKYPRYICMFSHINVYFVKYLGISNNYVTFQLAYTYLTTDSIIRSFNALSKRPTCHVSV